MKFIISCVLLLLLITSTTLVMAQAHKETDNTEKRFYIKAQGGYGFFTPGSYKVESRTTYTYQVNGTNRDTTIISLGKKGVGSGVRFGGGLGYIVNNFLNVGIDAEYLKGETLENKKTYSRTYSYNIVNSTLDYNVLILTPHVVFKAKSSSNYYIYNRLGLLISLPFDLEYASYDSTDQYLTTGSYSPPPTTYSNKSSNIKTTTGQYKVPVSLGLNVALGCQFKISENLRGFVEAFANFSVLTPKSYHEVNNTIYRSNSTSKNTATGATTITNTTQTYNQTYDYSYQKEGGISVVNTTDNTPQPTPVKNFNMATNTTTITNVYNYNSSQKQTSSEISRNMNAIGLNVGIAYRF